MKIFQSLIGLVILFIVSCRNNPQQNAALANTAIIKNHTDTVKYTMAMVDVKKDLACGMPLSAGIGDTAHYKGKVYGFCSTECKNDFLKDPDKYIVKVK